MGLNSRVLFFIFSGFWVFEAFPQDLGVQAALFEVQEESLLALLQKRLLETQKSGRLETLNEEMVGKVKKRLVRPRPLSLPRALQERRFYYDPSLVLEEDIKDLQGTILIPKGTRVNPLEFFPFGAPLLFLDGEDLSHLLWAKHQPKEAKWVLVKGGPFEVREREGRQVFFDQEGVLVKKLGITQVPAKVSQEGRTLLIQEVPLKKGPKRERIDP